MKHLILGCLLSVLHAVSAAPVQWWLTAIDQSALLKRMPNINIREGQDPTNTTTLNVDESVTHQPIDGYGAALSEAAAVNFLNLKERDESAYWKLLRSLYGCSGDTPGCFAMLRLPISASDFASSFHTYDDIPNDWQLKHVRILPDLKLKVLKDIFQIRPDLKVHACPWTAPAWLKTSANHTNAFYWGELDPSERAYETYAKYLAKVALLYNQSGAPFYTLSMQNEPLNEPNSYTVMRMSPADQARFAAHLGPALEAQGLGHVKILVFDHNWDMAFYPLQVYSNASEVYNSMDFIAGSAWHCYGGPVEAQSEVFEKYPNKEIHFTECSGTGASNFHSNIDWHTKNLYVGAIRHWARSVLHWNLALDENFGPHLGGCEDCRGVVTIPSNSSHIIYNEEYYGLAHFSMFLRRNLDEVIGLLNPMVAPDVGNGAVRTGNSWDHKEGTCMHGTAFRNVDGSLQSVATNLIQRNQYLRTETLPIGIRLRGTNLGAVFVGHCCTLRSSSM
eukprot:gene571-971_t